MSEDTFSFNLVPVDPGSETETQHESDNDNNSNSGGDNYSGFFEGPEKTLEVKFRPDHNHNNNNSHGNSDEGLRAMTRAQLDKLCALAKCTILSSISSGYVDAYVLSESSLFIYKHKYVMKTCGTTTLLRCLDTLLRYADELHLEVESVVYSRKNLICPTAQLWPHSSFGEEIKYMNKHANLQDRLHGNGYILGPVTGDHWFIYVADLAPLSEQLTRTNSSNSLASSSSLTNTAAAAAPAPAPVASNSSLLSPSTFGIHHNNSTDRTLNLMMFGMASEVCQVFFKKNVESGKEQTKISGIADLCPGAVIDETAFTPCGYSMNALLHDTYYTTHITPEEACSYASFETNATLPNYIPLVRNTLKVFRPKRFVVTMLGDEPGIKSMKELPTDLRRIDIPGIGSFVRTSLSSTKVETDQMCLMACFCIEDTAPIPRRSSKNGVVISNNNSLDHSASGTPRKVRGHSVA